MKSEGIDKKIILWSLILLLPIIFTMIVIVVKNNISKPKANYPTYVHVFYVENTDSLTEIKQIFNNINEPFRTVYHNISEENALYEKVLNYLDIDIKIYNPLIMINNDYFLEDYDEVSLKKAITLANETYQKKTLTKEENLKYNIVDRLELDEPVYKEA